ncbi:MAG: hypothetical protein ABEJ98_05235 [Candidatus Nanohaloarchaea archaeon]
MTGYKGIRSHFFYMAPEAREGMEKPTIHVSNDDAERAEKLGVGRESPSTVYTMALEEWEKFEDIKEKARQLQEKYPDIGLGELLDLMEDIEKPNR